MRLLHWSFYLFLFILPIQTILILRQPVIHGAVWQYGVIGWYASEVVLWVSVILWFFWYWRQACTRVRMPWEWSPDRVFVFAVLAFVLFAYASAWWAPYPDLALQQARRILEAVLFGLAILFGPIDIRKTAVFFIGGAVAAALLGIWQFVFQDTFASTLFGLSAHPIAEPGTSVVAGDGIGRWLRAYGPFAHPNVFGGYMALALATCFIFFTTHTPSTRLRALSWSGAIAICTAGLFFSFSRSAWIAWGIGIVCSLFFLIKRSSVSYRVVALSFFVFIILAIAYAPLTRIRFLGESATEIRSIDERVGQYEQAAALFKAHPWFGVGVGNDTAALVSRDASLPGWAYQPVHHTVFLILIEIGVVGFALASLVLVSGYSFLVSKGVRQWKRAEFLLPLIPLLFFDHYLWSSFSGLLLGVFFSAWYIRFARDVPHP